MLAPTLASPLATVYAKALAAFLFTVTVSLLTVVVEEHVKSKCVSPGLWVTVKSVLV